MLAVRGALPAGQHELQFGFASGSDWHATAAARVEVPDLSSKTFAVSHVFVSAGPSDETSGSSLEMLPARADATFALSESLAGEAAGALAGAKRLIRSSWEATRAESAADEVETIASAVTSPEAQERLERFVTR